LTWEGNIKKKKEKKIGRIMSCHHHRLNREWEIETKQSEINMKEGEKEESQLE
jgi:hypothetical protein